MCAQRVDGILKVSLVGKAIEKYKLDIQLRNQILYDFMQAGNG